MRNRFCHGSTTRVLIWTLLITQCLAGPIQAPLAIPHHDHQNSRRSLQLEVHPPVFSPNVSANAEDCVQTVVLMEHVFANSYGAPFVGAYTPPDCGFNHVTINFTVAVRGRQFDRLGLMYLGDIEVFRTSTSEPSPKGIVWSYVKEMDQYLSLWQQEQTLIFDLPNIVNHIYTGPLHTALTATFSVQSKKSVHADQILPISAKRSSENKGSAFTVPEEQAQTGYVFERNIERAVVSLSACGQQEEEFWYSNVLSGNSDTFESTSGSLGGFSPFREIQLLIDGQLAGASWPFPVVFTGGLAPGFWRPVVGIDAYDLRQTEIDITPWLHLFTDGKKHNFEIRVVGLDDSGSRPPLTASINDHVGGFWIVTGTIFLFKSAKVSTELSRLSQSPTVRTPPPEILLSSVAFPDSKGRNESLSFTVLVRRDIFTVSPDGRSMFNQSFTYLNTGRISEYGRVQETVQSTVGIDHAISQNHEYRISYSYPLAVNTVIRPTRDRGFTIDASLSRGQRLSTNGQSVFPNGLQNWTLRPDWDPMQLGASPFLLSEDNKALQPRAELQIHQEGTARYRAGRKLSYSIGELQTDLEFAAEDDTTNERYSRYVWGANGTVGNDYTRLEGGQRHAPSAQQKQVQQESVQSSIEAALQTFEIARDSPRAIVGRGPGTWRPGYSPHNECF